MQKRERGDSQWLSLWSAKINWYNTTRLKQWNLKPCKTPEGHPKGHVLQMRKTAGLHLLKFNFVYVIFSHIQAKTFICGILMETQQCFSCLLSLFAFRLGWSNNYYFINTTSLTSFKVHLNFFIVSSETIPY